MTAYPMPPVYEEGYEPGAGDAFYFHAATGTWRPKPTPALFGVGASAPGAGMASFINEGYGTMTPIPSLFDGAPLGFTAADLAAFQAGAKSGNTMIVGTDPPAATFIGHPVNLIYRSTDGGQSWTGIATPWDAGMGTSSVVLAVTFGADPNHVLAVGTDQSGHCGAMKSSDGGLTWSNVTTPLTGHSGAIVSCAFDGTRWFITEPSGIIFGVGLWSSPDLTTWTARTSGITDESVIMVLATPTLVMCGGGTGGAQCLTVSTDHGTTFVHHANPFDNNGVPYGIVTDGEGHWLAWTPPGGGASSVGFTQSLDNGTTWTDLVPVPDFALQLTAAFDPATGLWVTVWGAENQNQNNAIVGFSYGPVVYTAPVANPLVFTPTAYIAPNVYCPAFLLPV